MTRKTGYRIIIALIIIFIVFINDYLLLHSHLFEKVSQNQTQIAKVTDEKQQIQKNFDDALVRLDSVSTQNQQLRQQADSYNIEIEKRKVEIRSILNKKNASGSAGKYKLVQIAVKSKVIDNIQTDPATKPVAVRIPVYFATDRAVTGSKNAELYFNGLEDPRPDLKLGMVEVSIPLNHHTAGTTDEKALLNFWSDARDTGKYFVLRNIYLLNEALFYTRLNHAIERSGDEDMFVFVHGFSNSFTDAAKRTAQLAYDLNFKGGAVMYSWPSLGKPNGYVGDADKVKTSTRHLQTFLEDLVKKSGAKKINLIAHSLGNEALTDALAGIQLPPGVVFNQVILAAPDVDAVYFATQIASRIVDKCRRITIYTSARDKALRVSYNVHNHIHRLGEGVPDIFVYKGINTIDASALACPDFFDHSYFAQSRVVLEDIFKLFTFDADPQKRNLEVMTERNGIYWAIRP